MLRLGVTADTQVVTIYITVVAKNARSLDGQRFVFSRGVPIVFCHRRIIHRLYRNGHGCQVREKLSIVSPVGEGVLTVEISSGRVGEPAGLGIERYHAIARLHVHTYCQATIHVTVVTQHPRSLDGQRFVFSRGVCIILGHRCIIHRCYGNGDRGRVKAAGTVINLIDKAI